MTIHPVRMNGTVVGVPQTYDYFNKTQERVQDFIVAHSRISPERLTNLMLDTQKMAQDIGTILIGEDAVREQIINEVGGLYAAMEKLYGYIAANRESNAKPCPSGSPGGKCPPNPPCPGV
jgi:ATP-dependent protease ClpP protease subunit